MGPSDPWGAMIASRGSMGKQESQSVVVEVAESVSGAAAGLDEQVDRLGGTVGGGAVGGEVGEQLGAPGTQGAAQARDLGDGAGQGVVDDLFGAGAAGGGVPGGVGGHEVLGDAPGGGDLTVRVAVGEAGLKPLPGPVAEAVGAAAQQPPAR